MEGSSTINVRDVENAILTAVAESRTLPARFNAFLDDVADTWRSFAPVGTGKYRKSIKTRSVRTRLTASSLRRGAPIGSVYSDDDVEKALAIEYGTSDTEEHAPMRKTYARYMT